ncbi:MAG: hypothetical protein DCC75_02595 [Proteobacteria bacterium]|nr:MAG: hypothetical protein DCC75_02595 [Pseudomonadota bacterium]
MARYIHEHSPRSNKSFVAINCAAMPSELLESELFGHESGSFTGATQTRTGVFEVASEGTIFLDEIGDMPHQLQVKLLRALQEREIKRVGSNKVIKINPRVIAATNRDIDQALELGRVREDLYYRLAVVQFNIPPLRTRSADIDLLCTFFLDYFGSKLGKVLEIDETAMDFLKRYSWPGNTRELENVIERAAILADDVITPDHLGIGIDIDFGLLDEAAKTLTEVADLAAKQAEIEFIRKVLGRTSGNKSKAAQLLGVSYKTLLNKVKEYGLNAPEFKI